MAHKRTNKLHTETIFVPTTNQAVKATGNIGSGATTAMNIASGQLGIISVDHDSATRAYGDFLQAGDVAGDVAAVKIVMGNSVSANTQNVNPFLPQKSRPFLESPIIHKDNVRSFSARLSALPTYDAKVFTGFTTPEDLTLYKMYAEMRSRRNDRDYGQNVDTVPVTYTTPDYTNTASITQPVAHLLQQVAHKFNLNSKAVSTSPNWQNKGQKPAVALAVDVSGGSGVALGTIDCGTSISVMTTTVNGVTSTSTIVADQTMVETVRQLIANTTLTAASTVEVINITTAGQASTPAVDALIVMGLDNELAHAYDDIYSTKVRVDVELGEAFQLQSITEAKGSDAFDGYGKGRQWRIQYDARAFGQKSLYDLTGHKDTTLDISLENLDETKEYTAYVLDVYDTEETLTTQGLSQKRIVILLESSCTCAEAGDWVTFDLSSTSDGDTYEFNGTTYEDDQSSNGVTGGNTAFNGTAAGLATAIETDNAGVRATVSGTDVTVAPCNVTQSTTATNLDSILKVWLESTSLKSKNVGSEFGSNFFLPA